MFEGFAPPEGYRFEFIPEAANAAQEAMERGAGAICAVGHVPDARDHMGRPLPEDWAHLAVALPIGCPLSEARCLAVAGAEFARAAIGGKPRIAWPNHVLLEDRRVCAVQCRAREGVVVLSYALDPAAAEPETFARAVTASLAEAISHFPENAPDLMQAYCQHCETVMRFVDTVYRGMPLYGFAFAVDRHGGLMVMTQDSRTIVTVYGGEATLAKGEPAPPEVPVFPV